MKKTLKKLALVSMITMLSSSIFASEMKKGVEELSPEVRVLLVKEMQGIEQGMKDVFSYIIAGNWPEVKKIAVKMGPFRILCQLGKIKNTKGHEYENRDRCRAIC